MARAKVAPADGLSIRYLPVNMAYAVMWGDSHILRIFNTRLDAEAEVSDLRRAVADLTPTPKG